VVIQYTPLPVLVHLQHQTLHTLSTKRILWA
jgi:hypothetical protein